MSTQPRPHDIFIVGAGRAGLTLARALLRSGHTILGTWNRTAASSARVRAVTGAPAFHGRIPQVARSASLILLCVTDDALPAMARQLVKDNVVGPGMVVAHLAGALDSTVLEGVKATGASVGSLHPVASFSEDSSLPVGTHFAIEGDDTARVALRALVEDLGGTPVALEPGQKPRYHAALVVASNYMVTLVSVALKMLQEAGLTEAAAHAMVGPLVEGTARNIRRQGATEALTGPVTRGDVNTVRVHLGALRDDPETLRLYALMGQQAVLLAEKQGLPRADADALLKLMRAALAEI